MSFRYGPDKKCSNCHKSVKEDVPTCPHCGASFVVKKQKENKSSKSASNLKNISIIAIVIIAIFAAYFLISGENTSAGEIQHVENIAREVGENDLGVSTVSSYGYTANKSLTTDYERIGNGQVYIIISDYSRGVTQEKIDNIIQGVLNKDKNLVKVNETTIKGKFNNYTLISHENITN